MKLDRRTLLVAGAAAGAMPAQALALNAPGAGLPAGGKGASFPPSSPASALPDVTEVIDLWPGGVGPGLLRPLTEEIPDRMKPGEPHDRYITGQSRPRMAVFRPKQPNGAAVLIAPGGGYVRVVVDKEGYELARWMAERGFTAFVLVYRLPGGDAHGWDWASGADTPLCDAQRAMRLIRYHAPAFGIEPNRVAAMGFSAGGHVCSDLAARFDAKVYAPVDDADRHSARPICAAPCYPVMSMHLPVGHSESRKQLLGPNTSQAFEDAHTPSQNLPANPPPHFLLHAEDDKVVNPLNTLMLRDALKAKGARVETHLFEQGGHGFGLRGAVGLPVAIWPQLWLNWAQTTGLL
ncbi:alpha/beta hydrolase [Novosphingobium rosa]|uniref:alpha/beta hydrolase n=1 Tax=Novosphingobium rosa TaxID=76978 RepID=UPI0008301837|nr:alpha/beta hydrolase [Novosphingobium rosa]